jgi:hypothetical protein
VHTAVFLGFRKVQFYTWHMQLIHDAFTQSITNTKSPVTVMIVWRRVTDIAYVQYAVGLNIFRSLLQILMLVMLVMLIIGLR